MRIRYVIYLAVAVFLVVAFALARSCSTSPKQRFAETFNIPLPSSQVVFFHYSASNWKTWVIHSSDMKFVNNLVASAQLTRETSQEIPFAMGSIPGVWMDFYSNKLPESYSRRNQDETWKIWIDRDRGMIAAEYAVGLYLVPQGGSAGSKSTP